MFTSARILIIVGVLLLIAGASLLDDVFFLLSQSKTTISTDNAVHKSLTPRNRSRSSENVTTAAAGGSGGEQQWIGNNGSVSNWKGRLSNNKLTSSNIDRTNNQRKIVSILLDELEHEDDSWFARLAFAKLLQLEAASQEYDILTELVVVNSRSDSNWTLCFPNMRIKKTTRPESHQYLHELLERKELEQKQWLGAERSLLLKATADSYRDGLYLIKQHYSNAIRYDNDDDSGISVPFLTIGVPPSWSEWTRVDELKHFMQVSPECCGSAHQSASPSSGESGRDQKHVENETVVYLDNLSPLQPTTLMQLLDSPNGTHIVLLSPPADVLNISLPDYDIMLQEKKVFNLEYSPVSGSLMRYCMLQQHHPTGFEFIASLDSPLAQWVAMTMNDTSSTSSARLIGELNNKNKNVRSNVRIEPLPTVLSSQLIDKVKTNATETGSPPPPTLTNAIAASPVVSNATDRPSIYQGSAPVGHPDNPVTILINLGGEMGNQISIIAHGYALKWMLEEDYNISAVTVLKHQRHAKWIRARKSMVACFPKTRSMDFEEGNVPEFDERSNQQSRWLGNRVMDRLNLRTHNNEVDIRESLEILVQALSNTTGKPDVPLNSNCTLPFIRTSTYAMGGYVNDRYYDRHRNMFQFDYDNPKCCGSERPQANEKVVHIRGYSGELGRKFKKKGFEELSPNKTADELLHTATNRDDPITVLSRYASIGTPYVDVLQARGWKNARFLSTETGEQSFCYLIRAQKEMVGYSMSTFASWGAMLGNATKARLYSLKSAERIAVFGEDGCFFRHNYTNLSLKVKMSFELYNSEDQDIEEQRQMELLKSGQRRRYYR